MIAATKDTPMVPGIPLISAALLALALTGVIVVRSRPIRVKLAAEFAMLLLIGACLVSGGASPLPRGMELARNPDGAWLRALAVVWWLIAARMIATLMVIGLGRDARSRQARLFSDLLAGGIYLTTALIILNSVLDLPVNGLLATSGVVAIVLGLALQNTLADVFSGIAVGLEQPFHIGDRITIAEHAEGMVVEINWRSIRIQTDGDDVATIPNSIVARSQIINRSVPTERRAASVEIPTFSSARSDKLMELAREAVMLCPAILEHPAPSFVFKHLGARTTTIGINYFVATTSALTPARSELLRQMRRLFRHAGIITGVLPTHADFLASTILFETLTPEQIARLSGRVIPRSLEPGAALFEQGSVGASLYIIRSGIFEVSRREAGGARTPHGRVGPGEYLGEISLLSGDPRQATVTALTMGEVLELPREAIETLLGEDNTVGAILERSMRRGLAVLDRDEAARACNPSDTGASLLGRVRKFLRLPAAHG